MVSIIMPAYNAEGYIEKAVCSVIRQTYTDWELLVIDDDSTDNTYYIAERLAKKDSRIKVFKNEKNMGVALTRNKGFDLCKGEYVALLDSDDIWLEEKLACQIDLMNSSNAQIVYCSYRIIDENGKKKCEDFIVPERIDYEKLLTKAVISCSTALLTREIIKKYRFMTEFYHEDLVLWLQLLHDGYKAHGVVEVLAEYRVFQGSRSSNKFKSIINRFYVYRDFLKLPFCECCVLTFKAAIIGLCKYKKAK